LGHLKSVTVILCLPLYSARYLFSGTKSIISVSEIKDKRKTKWSEEEKKST
jgi:hypothetical protein